MQRRAAIVTGGLRGLGRAMALGLAREGHDVLAVGHIPSDVEEMSSIAAGAGVAERVHGLVADLRRPEECDRVVSEAVAKLGGVHILVNNAGLTFTYIDPERYRRDSIQHFWKIPDEIIENVISVNVIAADRMARRVMPHMLQAGWGRIVNVTTKLDTMNRAGSHPYGASKAALEMATQVWAQDVEGTGVTVNIVNPGAGANTPGMAEEMKEMSRAGRMPRLVEAEEMVAPLLWVVSPAADKVNGHRFDALTWDASLAPAEAARRIGRPAGFQLYPENGVPAIGR